LQAPGKETGQPVAAARAGRVRAGVPAAQIEVAATAVRIEIQMQIEIRT